LAFCLVIISLNDIYPQNPMSEIELKSKYEFNMGGGVITLGFTNDDQIYSKMMMVKKTAPISSISGVIVKKGMMTSKLQYDIRVLKKEKDSLFQIIQVDAADEQGQRFAAELKSLLPKSATWTDKLEEKAVDTKDTSADRTYNMQVMWFIKGKTLAGQGWALQMIMSYGMLTLCTIGLALPLTLYAFMAGCHRVKTNAVGINIKKLTGSFFQWEEVDNIEVSKYHITITNYGAQVDSVFLLNFRLNAKNGKKKDFIIRSLEGKNFIKEMIERGKMKPEALELFGAQKA
jgi:hypothetical protein